MMVVSGPIKNVYLKKRIISLQVQDKVMYFYLQRNLMKKFGRYLVKGRFVSFKASDDCKVMHRLKTYQIDHFIKIIMKRHRKQVIYYDLSLVQDGIKELLEKKNNKMYLDLELSMHPFYKTKYFVQEIIQSGIIIEDHEGNILEESFDFVKPVKFPQVTTRTTKFLNITQEEVDSGITAREYHFRLKSYIDKYDPVIIVWGKNDMIALTELAEISGLEIITPREKFMNLLQIYKNYFNLKNDVGLFNCYESYGYKLEKQKHNALEDAAITRLIYHEFVKECNKVQSIHI